MKSIFSLIRILFVLSSLFWANVTVAAVEPVGQGTVTSITDVSYFEMTVNFSKPADAERVLVVVRQSSAPASPPVDGTIYTADPMIGTGDTTVAGCLFYCEYVVADAAASGSVTVTGLKEGFNHYFAVYAYNGTGVEINYNQTINATMQRTLDVPEVGKSHNELNVATGAGGTMTSADCANCHGSHHTSQLLPTGLIMENLCFSCHETRGVNRVSIHGGGTADCGTCHSMHSFRTEELYSYSPVQDHSANQGFNRSFVRKNMKKYFTVANGFPTDAVEPTIFQAVPGDYAFAAGDVEPVSGKYNAVCQTCHPSTVLHHNQDATDGHQLGSTFCIACHPHKNKLNLENAFLPAHQFAPEAGCSLCHGAAEDVIGTVHKRCGLCHVNAEGGGALHGSALDETLETPKGCVECHEAMADTVDQSIVDQAKKVAFHHATDNAKLGHCEKCHSTGAVDTAIAPRQLSCVRCHVEYSTGAMKINAFNLSLLNAAQPTNPRVGAATGHSFTWPDSAMIYDFRACLDCHSGLNDNYNSNRDIDVYPNAAQVIKPFHGYPGDWTKAYLYSGAGPLPGFAGSPPTAISNGLEDVYPPTYATDANAILIERSDANRLPYLYMWYHPGPALESATGPNPTYSGIRRFSTKMTGRNTSKSNNQKIYNDGNQGIANINTTTPPSRVVDFGKNGVVMLTGESLNNGLDSIVNKAEDLNSPLFTQSITVPYTGNRGWGGGDATAPFTTVPTWPNLTNTYVGDVIDIIKAEHNGTNLVVWASNTLGSAATLSIASYSGGSCTGNFTWSVDHWEKACTVPYTIGDTVTVRSSATASLDVTVPVNN